MKCSQGRLQYTENAHSQIFPKISTSQSLECEYVILYGKKDFLGVIILRILRWEYYHGGYNITTSFLRRRGKKVRKDVKIGAEIRVTPLLRGGLMPRKAEAASLN